MAQVKKRPRHAGRSRLAPEAQERVKWLLRMGYGESYIVNRLKVQWPDITREKVRTIRLREEGRTHSDQSVRDTRQRIITNAPLQFHEAALKVVHSFVRVQRLGVHLGHGACGAEAVAAVALLSAALAELTDELPLGAIGGQVSDLPPV